MNFIDLVNHLAGKSNQHLNKIGREFKAVDLNAARKAFDGGSAVFIHENEKISPVDSHFQLDQAAEHEAQFLVKESDDSPVYVAPNIVKASDGQFVVGWQVVDAGIRKTKIKAFKDKSEAEKFQADMKLRVVDESINEDISDMIFDLKNGKWEKPAEKAILDKLKPGMTKSEFSKVFFESKPFSGCTDEFLTAMTEIMSIRESIEEAKWQLEMDYGSGSNSYVNNKWRVFPPMSLKKYEEMYGEDTFKKDVAKGFTYLVSHNSFDERGGDKTPHVKLFKTYQEALNYYSQLKNKLAESVEVEEADLQEDKKYYFSVYFSPSDDITVSQIKSVAGHKSDGHGMEIATGNVDVGFPDLSKAQIEKAKAALKSKFGSKVKFGQHTMVESAKIEEAVLKMTIEQVEQLFKSKGIKYKRSSIGGDVDLTVGANPLSDRDYGPTLEISVEDIGVEKEKLRVNVQMSTYTVLTDVLNIGGMQRVLQQNAMHIQEIQKALSVLGAGKMAESVMERDFIYAQKLVDMMVRQGKPDEIINKVLGVAMTPGEIQSLIASSRKHLKIKSPDRGRPEPGKQYALTGGSDKPSIARGDSWADSEVKESRMVAAKKLKKGDKVLVYDEPYTVEEVIDDQESITVIFADGSDVDLDPTDKVEVMTESKVNERAWRYVLNFNWLKKFEDSEDILDQDAQQAAKMAIAEIDALIKDAPETATFLEDTKEDFEIVETEEEFNNALNLLYDVADGYDIWIDTNDFHQKSGRNTSGAKESKDRSTVVNRGQFYKLHEMMDRLSGKSIAEHEAEGHAQLKMGDVETVGTSLQGELINVTYDELVKVFGEPNSKGDEYKIDVEWEGSLNGKPFTIYNWKTGKNYLGAKGEDVRNITNWNIGGNSKDIARAVKQYFSQHVGEDQFRTAIKKANEPAAESLLDAMKKVRLNEDKKEDAAKETSRGIFKSILRKIHKATDEDTVDQALDKLMKHYIAADANLDVVKMIQAEAERKRARLAKGETAETPSEEGEKVIDTEVKEEMSNVVVPPMPEVDQKMEDEKSKEELEKPVDFKEPAAPSTDDMQEVEKQIKVGSRVKVGDKEAIVAEIKDGRYKLLNVEDRKVMYNDASDSNTYDLTELGDVILEGKEMKSKCIGCGDELYTGEHGNFSGKPGYCKLCLKDSDKKNECEMSEAKCVKCQQNFDGTKASKGGLCPDCYAGLEGEVTEGNSLNIDLKGKVVVLSSKYYHGTEDQRTFKCEHGFGIAPFTRGQAVFGYFISDGRRARVEGYEIEKLAKDQTLSNPKGETRESVSEAEHAYEEQEEWLDILDIAHEDLEKGMDFEEIVNHINDIPQLRAWLKMWYHGNDFDLRQELEAAVEDKDEDMPVDGPKEEVPESKKSDKKEKEEETQADWLMKAMRRAEKRDKRESGKGPKMVPGLPTNEMVDYEAILKGSLSRSSDKDILNAYVEIQDDLQSHNIKRTKEVSLALIKLRKELKRRGIGRNVIADYVPESKRTNEQYVSGAVQCANCGSEKSYDKCACPNDIAIATGYRQGSDESWYCPKCKGKAEESVSEKAPRFKITIHRKNGGTDYRWADTREEAEKEREMFDSGDAVDVFITDTMNEAKELVDTLKAADVIHAAQQLAASGEERIRLTQLRLQLIRNGKVGQNDDFSKVSSKMRAALKSAGWNIGPMESKVNETGEMGQSDIEEGGEDYEWAKAIQDDVEQIVARTGGKLKFEGMRPFDKYQGPYARTNMGRIWDAGVEGEEYLYIQSKEWLGTADDLADAINGDAVAIRKVEHLAKKAAGEPVPDDFDPAQMELPLESKVGESKINELTTWEDLGWEVVDEEQFAFAPNLTGYTVRYKSTKEVLPIISADEKFVQVKLTNDRQKEGGYDSLYIRKDAAEIPVGDGFVYGANWELLDPQGNVVQVDKAGYAKESKVNEVSPGLKKWRKRQKPGAIMKPSTFKKIEKSAAAAGATDPAKVAGAAYWKTAKAKYNEAVDEKDDKLATNADNWVSDRLENREPLMFTEFVKFMANLGYDKAAVTKLKDKMTRDYTNHKQPYEAVDKLMEKFGLKEKHIPLEQVLKMVKETSTSPGPERCKKCNKHIGTRVAQNFDNLCPECYEEKKEKKK